MVIIQLVSGLFLEQLLALVFGQVLVIQILSHLPLANIHMSINVF